MRATLLKERLQDARLKCFRHSEERASPDKSGTIVLPHKV